MNAEAGEARIYKTVGGMDAAVELTGTYSQRVFKSMSHRLFKVRDLLALEGH